jgi:hypothetical protein
MSRGVEHGRGAGVLPGVEQRRAEKVAQPELQRRVVIGALDAVLEQADIIACSVDRIVDGGSDSAPGSLKRTGMTS